MADEGKTGESGDSGNPAERLTSISDQFKGILMDIHSSMMEEVLGSGVGADVTVSDLITTDKESLEESLANSSEDVDMIDAAASTVATEDEEQPVLPSDDILPTAVINENDDEGDASDLFSSDLGHDWASLATSQQIPGVDGGLNGFMSFDEPNGGEEVAIKQEGETEPDDMTEASVGTSNYGGGCKIAKKGRATLTYKMFVSSFPLTWKNEQLEELFKEYGTVLECEIFQFKKFAFVHMETEEERAKAIKGLNGKIFNGYALSVQKSKQKITEFQRENEEIGSFKLYVGGLHQGVTKEYVTKLFEPYGRVVEALTYSGTSAFVHMEEESAAMQAMQELKGKLLPESEGSRLSVRPSKNAEGPKIPTIKLLVSNLGNDITAEIVRSLFQPFGLIIKCTVTNCKYDLLRKAVVHLEQLGDIRSALKELNGFELKGHKLTVKPIFDTEPVAHKKVVLKSEPSYVPPNNYGYEDYNYKNYEYDNEAPVLRTPPPPQRFRGRGGPLMRGGMRENMRGRGRGGINPSWQLVPMPSMSELSSMPRGGRGMRARGVVSTRGFFRGRGRPPHQPMLPQQFTGGPKRPYQNAGFDTDYDFDEYYEDPVAANSREHYATMAEEYDQYEEEYEAPVEYIPRTRTAFPLGYGLSGPVHSEYHPPLKKSRGRGGPGMMSYPGRGAQLPSLMGVEVEVEADIHDEEEPARVPYQPYGYQSLNFPLGEREYYRNVKQGNRKQDAMLQVAATTQRNQQEQKQKVQQLLAQQQQQKQWHSQQKSQAQKQQQFQQQWGSPQKSQVQQQQWNQQTKSQPQNYSNYLVPEQIPSSSSNHSNLSTAYPSNYYTGSEQNQTVFPPGVNPEDYPNLKPGAKVYINGSGKVMVRGSRGGRGKKPRHPGLGSKGPNNSGTSGGGKGVVGLSGANQVQVGTPLRAGPSYFTSNSNYSRTKEQTKEENQEYTTWLQQKSWLHTAIPGTIRPSKH